MVEFPSCKHALVEMMDATVSLLIKPEVFMALITIAVLLLALIRMQSLGGMIGGWERRVSLALALWIGAFVLLKTVANEKFQLDANSLIAACTATNSEADEALRELR